MGSDAAADGVRGLLLRRTDQRIETVRIRHKQSVAAAVIAAAASFRRLSQSGEHKSLKGREEKQGKMRTQRILAAASRQCPSRTIQLQRKQRLPYRTFSVFSSSPFLNEQHYPLRAADKPPHRLRISRPYLVNEDPEALHAFYARLFGIKDVVKLGFISEPLAWQAVTHKSFAHGFQPYNETLSFLGRRIIELHVVLFQSGGMKKKKKVADDGASEETVNINDIVPGVVEGAIDREMLGAVAKAYGMQSVLRWKPRLVSQEPNVCFYFADG